MDIRSIVVASSPRVRDDGSLLDEQIQEFVREVLRHVEAHLVPKIEAIIEARLQEHVARSRNDRPSVVSLAQTQAREAANYRRNEAEGVVGAESADVTRRASANSITPEQFRSSRAIYDQYFRHYVSEETENGRTTTSEFSGFSASLGLVCIVSCVVTIVGISRVMRRE